MGNTLAVLRPGRYLLPAAFVVCILFVVLKVHLRVTATIAAWIVIGLFFTIHTLAVCDYWRTQPLLALADGEHVSDGEAQ